MPHIFDSSPFDRVPTQRADEAWVRAQLDDPRGRYLALHDLTAAAVLGERPALAWIERPAAERWAHGDEIVLLGMLDGIPHFAAAIDDEAAAAIEGIQFAETRALSMELTPDEAGILAHARSLLAWHESSRFCARCGNPTRPAEGAARRHCDGCGAHHYPQISPSMIVLVERGDFCLLGRRARGVPNRYSCLAGYIEAGESIEHATIREVFEESGVRVGNVTYHSSQPWPFPATLMIGCFAQAESEEIRVDGVEVVEARWVSREDARLALDGQHPSLVLPDRAAIAHGLIRAWVERETPTASSLAAARDDGR